MIKNILYVLLLSSSIFAIETQVDKQQNVLQVQKIIEIEEKIAQNFEKYLLEKFSIPTIAQLKTNDYLGANTSLINKFGSTISFKDSSSLKLNYAITTENDPNDYKNLLYERDLYRDYTSVYQVVDSNKKVVSANSYTKIELQSDEAKNIYSILSASSENTIEPTCSSTLASTYCNVDDMSIRWYDTNSNWIQYDKKKFKNGNVTISVASLLTSSRLDDLPVGAYIFLNNGSKYVKLMNNILKVD